MAKIYQVIHVYDVDSGFGDPVAKERVVFTTTKKEIAEKWVEKWNHPIVYKVPYSNLYCYRFEIVEIVVNDNINEDTNPTELGVKSFFIETQDEKAEGLARKLYREDKSLNHEILAALSDYQQEED